MQSKPGPLYRKGALNSPSRLKYVWTLFVLKLKSNYSTHIRSGQQKNLFFVVRINFISAGALFEGVLLLGFVLQAPGGNAPAVQITDLGLVVKTNVKFSVTFPFRTQNPISNF